MMDSFLVIFSNISEQLFQGTPSDDCFLKIFFHGSSRPKVLEKLLWKIWEISEENVLLDIYFFIFSEQNHSTTHSFLRILYDVLEQLFCRTLPDGCFWEYLGKLSFVK